MTHAALIPLLGREFDDFLFASIGDDRNGPLLSVVSALARLDVDPWKEAVNLAGMPKEQAMERLTSLLASLPKGATASLSPELVAASLIALLPGGAFPAYRRSRRLGLQTARNSRMHQREVCSSNPLCSTNQLVDIARV